MKEYGANKKNKTKRFTTRLRRGVYRRVTIKKMHMLNRFSRMRLVDSGGHPIVSLTSYGDRLSTVHLVIETLFRQSVPPAAVYLWLHESDVGSNGLPLELERLRKRGLCIEFVPENIKGAKKLVYAAQRFPHRTIVTVDDDFIYSRHWLGGLLKESKRFPQQVIAWRAWYLRLQYPDEICPYKSLMNQSDGGDEASFNILPTGNAGVLYPPYSLHETISNIDLMTRLCPEADDIWFKAMTMLQGVKSKRVETRNMKPQKLDNFSDSLWFKNEEDNDKYLKNVFDYFNLYDYLD